MICSHEEMGRFLCKLWNKIQAKQSDAKTESSLGFLYRLRPVCMRGQCALKGKTNMNVIDNTMFVNG